MTVLFDFIFAPYASLYPSSYIFPLSFLFLPFPFTFSPFFFSVLIFFTQVTSGILQNSIPLGIANYGNVRFSPKSVSVHHSLKQEVLFFPKHQCLPIRSFFRIRIPLFSLKWILLLTFTCSILPYQYVTGVGAGFVFLNHLRSRLLGSFRKTNVFLTGTSTAKGGSMGQ